MQQRKVTYKLYPTPTQMSGLATLRALHKDLWNAALEERIDAYRKTGKGRSFEDQSAALTALRAEMPEAAAANCSAQQVTLRRLDKAFQAFFRRVAHGETPGFPRFKSLARMPSVGFKSHGDGWRFTPGKNWKNGTLRLQGIGHMRARGRARVGQQAPSRQGGVIKSCEILHRDGGWYLSLTVEFDRVERKRTANKTIAGDWGVDQLLALTERKGGAAVSRIVENPRWYENSKDMLVALDQAVARKKRGSKAWRRAGAERAKARAKLARKRNDYQHKLSAQIAAQAKVFATEKLNLKAMTASAAGTADAPGKNVPQKAGLNREILDTAPAALFQKIAYKVLETGGRYLVAPTRELKPSQTCPKCGAQRKKSLSERRHRCSCGFEADRDVAASQVVLQWALEQTRVKPTNVTKKMKGRNCPKRGQTLETTLQA